MVTCFLKYIIDPDKVKEFEHYGKLWIDLVNKMGGTHHGYLLPHEGASNVGYASFSFPSLAAYEEYRLKIPGSQECREALDYAAETKCVNAVPGAPRRQFQGRSPAFHTHGPSCWQPVISRKARNSRIIVAIVLSAGMFPSAISSKRSRLLSPNAADSIAASTCAP